MEIFLSEIGHTCIKPLSLSLRIFDVEEVENCKSQRSSTPVDSVCPLDMK